MSSSHERCTAVVAAMGLELQLAVVSINLASYGSMDLQCCMLVLLKDFRLTAREISMQRLLQTGRPFLKASLIRHSVLHSICIRGSLHPDAPPS